MIEMSIIEYFAGDYSGNIIYPLPNSVKTSIMLARCNHCVSKTVNFGDRPALAKTELLGPGHVQPLIGADLSRRLYYQAEGAKIYKTWFGKT